MVVVPSGSLADAGADARIRNESESMTLLRASPSGLPARRRSRPRAYMSCPGRVKGSLACAPGLGAVALALLGCHLSNHERTLADLVVDVLELLATTLVVALALRLHRVPLGPSTLPLYFRARATRHALPCRGEVVKPPSAGTGVAPVRRRRDVTSACRRRAIRSPWARRSCWGRHASRAGPQATRRGGRRLMPHASVFHVDTSVGMRRRSPRGSATHAAARRACSGLVVTGSRRPDAVCGADDPALQRPVLRRAGARTPRRADRRPRHRDGR